MESESAAAVDSVEAHPVEAYTGTPGGSAGGFLAMLAVGLAGAVVIGGLAAILHKWFWLVLVFPAIYGLVLGGLTGLGARVGKYRVLGGAVAAGALVGVVGAILLHYFTYQLAMRENQIVGFLTFTEYLDLSARAGVGIGSIQFGYSGTIIYWLVEAIVVVIASAAAAQWPVRRPFCAGCNAWKEKKQLGVFQIDGPRAVAAISTGQPLTMVGPATADDKVTVSLYKCPRCGSSDAFEAEVVATRGKGEGAATVSAIMTYPAAAAADFEEARRTCEERGYGTK
jgi:hypothetical protein